MTLDKVNMKKCVRISIAHQEIIFTTRSIIGEYKLHQNYLDSQITSQI